MLNDYPCTVSLGFACSAGNTIYNLEQVNYIDPLDYNPAVIKFTQSQELNVNLIADKDDLVQVTDASSHTTCDLQNPLTKYCDIDIKIYSKLMNDTVA